MAAPTLQAAGALAAVASGTTITAVNPTHQTDDILVVVYQHGDNTNTFTTPTGWTAGPEGRIATGAEAFQWFWKRATSGSETDPSTTCSVTMGTNTGGYGRVYVIDGAITTGDPWDDTSQANEGNVSVNVNHPSVTVSGADRLVCYFIAVGDDNTWSSGMPPTGYTQIGRLASTTGSDSMMDGIWKASSSTEDPAASVMSAIDPWVSFGISFKPPAGGGTDWTTDPADSVTMSDGITVELGRTAAVDDSVTPSDAQSFERGLALADTASLTDAQTFDRGLALADTASVADALSREFGLNPADTVGLADATQRDAGKGVTIDDSVTAYDMGTYGLETYGSGIYGSFDMAAGRNLAINDTLSLADALAFTRSLAINDSVSLADTQRFDRTLALADTLSLADALKFDREIVLGDVVGLSDFADPVLTPGAGGTNWEVPINDTVSVADALTFVREIALSDNVTIGDALAFDRAIVIAEALGVADTAVPAVGFNRAVNDTVGVADATLLERALNVQINDTVPVADVLAFMREIHLADAVALSDARELLLNGAPIVTVTEMVRKWNVSRFGIY